MAQPTVEQKVALCKEIAVPLHTAHNALIANLHSLLGEDVDTREKYLQIMKQTIDRMASDVDLLIRGPDDETCSRLVKRTRQTPEYISFNIEFAPNVEILWTCSKDATEGEKKDEPWHKTVVQEFARCAGLVDSDLRRVLEFGCGLEHGCICIKDSGADVILYDHYSETPDGWELNGFTIILPKERFARILKGISVQTQRYYS
jgi:hypothetical protein